jgi:hypothetical protein
MQKKSEHSLDRVRVGAVLIPLDKARRWLTEYTNEANVFVEDPYSYPAYDLYECDRNEQGLLTDADLLAPGLLNVPVKIRSYYALQRIRPLLEDGLRNIDLGFALADVDPAHVASMVKPLYAVLDDPQTRPWGVSGTTLSKILHRKRPQSIVLHDRWVRRCYVGGDAPVQPSKDRSWADYMVAVSLAIRDDLQSQREVFASLDEATSSPGRLSHVRLLDILAWKSKGKKSD